MAAVDNYLYLYWSNFKKDSKPDFNIIENMKEKILSILTEINEDIAGYEGDGLLEDGIIASLDVIEIVSALEDEFGIIIAAKSITKENFASVDSICALVESLQ